MAVFLLYISPKYQYQCKKTNKFYFRPILIFVYKESFITLHISNLSILFINRPFVPYLYRDIIKY